MQPERLCRQAERLNESIASFWTLALNESNDSNRTNRIEWNRDIESNGIERMELNESNRIVIIGVNADRLRIVRFSSTLYPRRRRVSRGGPGGSYGLPTGVTFKLPPLSYFGGSRVATPILSVVNPPLPTVAIVSSAPHFFFATLALPTLIR